VKARRIAVIDSETDPFRLGRIPAPFIWGWYDGEDYLTFDTTAALAEFLRGRNEITYCHNAGKYDFFFMLDYLDAYSDLLIINGRITSMRIGVCELRDSFSILPIPLAAYKKDEIDYSIMEPLERVKPHNRAVIEAYLKADCVYLFELVRGFIDRFGSRMTLAGAAMAQWQKIAGSPVRTDAAFYETFAPYYYGGRVECFEHGIVEKTFDVFDINSAYPWAMRGEHPCGKAYTVENRNRGADFYEIECESHGAFPFRGMGHGLSFPADGERRTFFVTEHERVAAENTNCLVKPKFHTSIRFAQHQSFAEYVDKFFAEKKAAKESGEKAGEIFAKLMLNSLYGKFSANPAAYLNYCVFPLENAFAFQEGYEWQFAGELGPWGLASKPLEESRRRYYNVATGASITGQVRALLWQSIAASRGVLYCDTDSIAVQRVSEGLEISGELGAWKHEGRFSRAGIAGKKLYIFKGMDGTPDKMAAKGVRLTAAELWTVAAGGSVDYAREAPTFSIRNAPKFISRKVVQTARAA
jgi:hypothetical protein